MNTSTEMDMPNNAAILKRGTNFRRLLLAQPFWYHIRTHAHKRTSILQTTVTPSPPTPLTPIHPPHTPKINCRRYLLGNSTTAMTNSACVQCLGRCARTTLLLSLAHERTNTLADAKHVRAGCVGNLCLCLLSVLVIKSTVSFKHVDCCQFLCLSTPPTPPHCLKTWYYFLLSLSYLFCLCMRTYVCARENVSLGICWAFIARVRVMRHPDNALLLCDITTRQFCF